MLKSLLIRQAFLVLDFALAVLVAAVAVWVILAILDSGGLDVARDGAGGVDVSASLDIAQVAPKDAYAPILDSGLFGEAARISNEAPPPPPPPEPSTEIKMAKDAGINIDLLGAVAAGPTDPRATAVLKTATSPAATYYLNSEVMSNLTLREVHPRAVLLQNETNAERYWVVMGEEERIDLASLKTAGELENEMAGDPRLEQTEFEASQTELLRKAMNEQEQLQSLTPRAVTDAAGNIVGITADGIGDLEIAREFGVQEGDAVQEINGIPVDDVEKLQSLGMRLMGQKSISVTLLRDGQTITKTINVN